MKKEILPDLYTIEIPLPGNPLKALNSYIIKGGSRNLLIDTGFNRKECFEAMQEGLKELDVDLSKTDIFLTHLHADHTGLVSRLATKDSIVYFNRPDSEMTGGWGNMGASAGENGFPENQLEAALKSHPGYKYSPEAPPAYTILEDGDRVDVGAYHFQCVQTPGHTRGHMCLYDADKKLLLSGDHILIDITPNIACFSEREDPLHDYLASLDRVYQLDVTMTLPGHRRIMDDHRARIEELRVHHRERADEVLEILRKGPLNAFQIASQMTWDITYPSWDMFPVSQRWFATGEAIAHVRFLESNGEIKRNKDGKVITFSIN
ncbi:MAG: MBL fold metallo-hydrolase [Deltaproteobacteria bacterium]|nr:MBL fold metallo-hydrolase [Deltaproteobacteria bacterium]